MSPLIQGLRPELRAAVPPQLAVQPDSGHVFFSEDYGGVVYCTEFGGTGRTTWVSGFRSGDDDPVCIAFAPDSYLGSVLEPGKALIVDRGNNGYGEVWWWSPFVPESEYQVHPDDGTLIDPLDVVIGWTTVNVVDSGLAADGAIYILEPGSSLSTLTTPAPSASPAGITIDRLTEDLLVADQGAGPIVRLVLDAGQPLVMDMQDVVTGLTAGSILWAGVEITPDGRRLIVTDWAASKIYVFALCDASAWPGRDCDGNGVLDDCETALHPSLLWNNDGVLDRCQQGVVAVGSGSALRTLAWLERNRPNPFNPRTTLVFELGKPSDAQLQVCDLKGRLISTLVAETELAPGRYEVDFKGILRERAARRSASHFSISK